MLVSLRQTWLRAVMALAMEQNSSMVSHSSSHLKPGLGYLGLFFGLGTDSLELIPLPPVWEQVCKWGCALGVMVTSLTSAINAGQDMKNLWDNYSFAAKSFALFPYVVSCMFDLLKAEPALTVGCRTFATFLGSFVSGLLELASGIEEKMSAVALAAQLSGDVLQTMSGVFGAAAEFGGASAPALIGLGLGCDGLNIISAIAASVGSD